jgi:histidine triad (HIT) family protein
MSDCIFCKILNKEVPNYTVYEDENVLAFLDIFPHAKGHTVVIPKRHAETYLGLSEVETQGLASGVQNAMKKIAEVLHPDGFNVGWNERPAGGQVVPHLHVHIFPRYNGDGGGSVHSIVKKLENFDVKEVAKLFV